MTVLALVALFASFADAKWIGEDLPAGIKAVSEKNCPVMRRTFVVQSATPMLAVLPILADEAHGDVKYATNIVVMSTVLFVIVVPILMSILQFI